ncbi:Nesprin-1 [Desmophyllum pertusum]|uniref:Nesprin-1 n=1 Tax=Desmophyllum pertusum TaxID=174260 RepID=A0A9W9Y9R8_9CNID|nr:Nesprin-1 [Desmophyllum pertusum]
MASRSRNSISSTTRSPSPEKSLGLAASSLSASTEQLVASLSEEQVLVQKRTFGRWVNHFLQKHKPPLHVDDLIEGLQDGTKLLALLEVLSGERLPKEKGNKRPHHLANVGSALKFLTTKNVKLVNIHRESVVDGNETLVLGLIWAIIHHFQVEGFYANKKKARTKKYLLEWTQKAAQKATGSSEAVKNFGSSWKNGQAFLHVIHAFRPDLVDLSAVQGRDDVNVEKPDEKSIVTYLATLCDTLESEKTKSPKRPASPTKTAPKKSPSSSPSPSSKGTGSRTLSPEPSSPGQSKRSPSPVKTKTKDSTPGVSSPSKGGEGRAITSSPTPPKKQTEQSRRSSSPLKSKDQRTSSTTPPPGNGKGKAQGNNVRSGTSSPKSSTADEPMDTSPDKETNLSPHKRREARSTSPSPTSTAPKKPRVSQGKLSASSDHSDRLKSKRHSLAVESKKLSVPGEPGHKKRASVAGTLSTSRKLSSGSRKLSSGSRKSSSTGPAPMDVESSSSDLEDSEDDEEEFEAGNEERDIEQEYKELVDWLTMWRVEHL